MRRAKLHAHDVTRVIVTATMKKNPSTVEDLLSHRRSLGFFDSGFHYFVDSNARVHHGVPLDERGSYFERYSRTSVVILMDGKGDYTQEQLTALRRLIKTVQREYPHAETTMHHELFFGTNPVIPKEALNGE